MQTTFPPGLGELTATMPLDWFRTGFEQIARIPDTDHTSATARAIRFEALAAELLARAEVIETALVTLTGLAANVRGGAEALSTPLGRINLTSTPAPVTECGWIADTARQGHITDPVCHSPRGHTGCHIAETTTGRTGMHYGHFPTMVPVVAPRFCSPECNTAADDLRGPDEPRRCDWCGGSVASVYADYCSAECFDADAAEVPTTAEALAALVIANDRHRLGHRSIVAAEVAR